MTTWDDVARLCLALPETGERTSREGARQWRVLIAEEPDVYSTTAHFTGYPAVLCRLDRLDAAALEELVTEAWACRAPRRLVEQRLGAGR